MLFRRMQNKIYRSLVTIQYHTKCTNTLYPKFTSKKISVYIFCCNLYLVISYVLILTTDKCSHPFISNCTRITLQLLQQKCTDMAYPSQYDSKLKVKHLYKNYKIRCHTFGRASNDFEASHYGIQTIKIGLNHF